MVHAPCSGVYCGGFSSRDGECTPLIWNIIFGTHKYDVCSSDRRSHWPCGLRHGPSLLTRTLGSWVLIPLKAWMSVCVYSVFVFFCMWVAALRRADPPSKEFYRLCTDKGSGKMRPRSTRATEPWIRVDRFLWPADIIGRCFPPPPTDSEGDQHSSVHAVAAADMTFVSFLYFMSLHWTQCMKRATM
jgi:hypothetical protein